MAEEPTTPANLKDMVKALEYQVRALDETIRGNGKKGLNEQIALLNAKTDSQTVLLEEKLQKLHDMIQNRPSITDCRATCDAKIHLIESQLAKLEQRQETADKLHNVEIEENKERYISFKDMAEKWAGPIAIAILLWFLTTVLPKLWPLLQNP